MSANWQDVGPKPGGLDDVSLVDTSRETFPPNVRGDGGHQQRTNPYAVMAGSTSSTVPGQQSGSLAARKASLDGGPGSPGSKHVVPERGVSFFGNHGGVVGGGSSGAGTKGGPGPGAGVGVLLQPPTIPGLERAPSWSSNDPRSRAGSSKEGNLPGQSSSKDTLVEGSEYPNTAGISEHAFLAGISEHAGSGTPGGSGESSARQPGPSPHEVVEMIRSRPNTFGTKTALVRKHTGVGELSAPAKHLASEVAANRAARQQGATGALVPGGPVVPGGALPGAGVPVSGVEGGRGVLDPASSPAAHHRTGNKPAKFVQAREAVRQQKKTQLMPHDSNASISNASMAPRGRLQERERLRHQSNTKLFPGDFM